MDIVEKAFRGIFPYKEFNYDVKIIYSGRFKSYNANVKYTNSKMTFNLSKQWKDVDEDIKIGLIQVLLLKVFRKTKRTFNIDLYNSFLKNVHVSVPKTKTHPILETSFDRMNEKFFHGLMERPNLVLCKRSVSKLGSYEYGSDTIKINDILLEDLDALDYVMYHEMLHKHFKFGNGSVRNRYHTKAFKEAEKAYPGWEMLEKRLGRMVSKKRNLIDMFF